MEAPVEDKPAPEAAKRAAKAQTAAEAKRSVKMERLELVRRGATAARAACRDTGENAQPPATKARNAS